MAERTGCAIVLVGHLNKAVGASTAYRGLGSIDFRAAARSVLLVGRMRKEPNVRVIVHDKSSLAPEGKSMAFNLGNENGFCWLDGYGDITAAELLSGTGADAKTAAAEKLILDMLSDGEKVPCESIFSEAKASGISRRTVNEAKKNIPGIQSIKTGKGWSWLLAVRRLQHCSLLLLHCKNAASLQEDNHGRILHCCIVNLVPPVRAVLPLCRKIFFLWGSNPNMADDATMGQFWGNSEHAPAGAGFLLPSGSSQHRVRLVAARRKNRAEARNPL